MDAKVKYRKEVERQTRIYVRKLDKDFLRAFSLGFDDGMSGKGLNCPPPSGEGLEYAAQLLAVEMYKKGFSCGREVSK